MSQGAKFEIAPLTAAQLKSAKLQQLFRFWYELRGTRPMPARADFGPEELTFALGQISLIEVTHDPVEFRFRLVGTKVEEAGRRGDQHKTLAQIEPVSYRETLAAAYQSAVSHREPSLNLVTVQRRKNNIWYEQLVLPFTVDGERVEFLLDGIDWPSKFKNGLAGCF